MTLNTILLVAGAIFGHAVLGQTSTPTDPTPSPTGTLIPSPDGTDGLCGGPYTCLGSVFGDCCSANGYCGNTTDYCGTGCNPAFGKCGGGTPPEVTITVTAGGPSTVTVTAPGSAVTVIVTAPGTVITSIRTSTVTSVVTSTLTRTITPTATQPSGPVKPSPLVTGTYAQCSQYYQIKRGDTCRTIEDNYGMTADDMADLNPNLNCNSLTSYVGYYICVAY